MGSNNLYSSMADDALENRYEELNQSLVSNQSEIDTHQENVSHGDSADKAGTIMILNSLRRDREFIRSEMSELKSEIRNRALHSGHTC